MMTTTPRQHPPPRLFSYHMGCLAPGPTGPALPSKSTRGQAEELWQWMQETMVTVLTLIKCAMQAWQRTWKDSYQNFSLVPSVWLVTGRFFAPRMIWNKLLSVSSSMGGRTTMQLALTSNLPLDKVVVVDVSPVNQVSFFLANIKLSFGNPGIWRNIKQPVEHGAFLPLFEGSQLWPEPQYLR